MYAVMYQNVSAIGEEIVNYIIKISTDTPNGPILASTNLFGASVANIGDLNGDGTSDIAVGATGDNTGGNGRGAIHVLFMNGNGSVSNTVVINSDTPNGPVLDNNDRFGTSIVNIGDLNGDGISDILVGAHRDDGDGANRGAIHVLFMNGNGSVSNTVEINDTSTNGPVLDNSDFFGSSIANIGDLNDDGISDIAVGANYDDGDGIDKGAIHVLLLNGNGSVSDTMEINSTSTNGPVLSSGDFFGSSIANIGDLNGDGTSDIAVGAIGSAGTMRGAIHILFMNSNGSISDTMEINSTSTNGPVLNDLDRFGLSIANIDDLNNDGISDIAVGAPFADSNKGVIHVMIMNSNGTVSRIIEIKNNTTNGPVLTSRDHFGYSIANIGDRNGDGTLDIVVGAYGDNTGVSNAGAIYTIIMNRLDETMPIITNITSNATTLDILKVGDTISFTLDLNSTENNASVNGTYNSIPLLWNSTNDGITYIANYTVSEGETDQTTPLQITNVTITDNAGNTSLPFNGTDILSTIDANSPKFVSGKTLSISRIVITLDHNVTNNTASPNDFTLGGVASGSVDSIVSVLNNTVTLDIVEAEILDSDSITISYNRTVGSLDEISGNSLLNFTGDVTNNLDTPPVITLTGDNPQIIDLGDGYTELGATTNDGSPVIINSTEFVDALGTYHTYYDSTDVSGLNAIQVNRTVIIVNTTPPIITLIGENPQIIELGDGYTELGATTNDGSPVIINSTEFVDALGTYHTYYDSTDVSGFNAIQVNRTVIVVDTTPPIITLIGENPQIIKLGDGYTELGATTDDIFPVTINSDEFMDEVCSYSIYYNSVDASGNNAFQRIRTVNVVDSTPPPSCIIPDSGKWTINGNCMVDSDVTAPGDVLVQNHSTLTVPSGVTLDIDFTEFNLTIQYCSGVSVKSGGTLT